MPTSGSFQFQKFALYTIKTESTPTSVTIRRDFALGESLFLVNEYPDLRAFYNKIETKDQESVVLKMASTAKGEGAGN